jgi:pimeloyl-ACP methyl ester carboxylesterase
MPTNVNTLISPRPGETRLSLADAIPGRGVGGEGPTTHDGTHRSTSNVPAIPLRYFFVAAWLTVALPFAPLRAEDDVADPIDCEFTAEFDGSAQRYVLLLPAEFDESKTADIVIALHGHGSDRWQYVRADRGECRGVRDVAARRRMIMISPDYRATTSWMGPAAEADIVQLIARLREQYRVRHVYLAGASMGGTSVLIFAALHPDLVDGVLSENGTANMVEYDRFQDAIAASYGGSRSVQPDEYRKRSPELSPDQLTMPLAFTVGGRDTIVPPDSVRRLSRRLKGGDRDDVLLIDHPDGGHATDYDDTVTAFEFVIRQAESRIEAP